MTGGLCEFVLSAVFLCVNFIAFELYTGSLRYPAFYSSTEV